MRRLLILRGGKCSNASGKVMQRRAGGRLYERTREGGEFGWGEVVAWEPPHRVVFTWHLGKPIATEVEVRFTSEGDRTRVDLEHRGWERLGAEAPEERASYDGGWDFVLGRYVETTAGARSGT